MAKKLKPPVKTSKKAIALTIIGVAIVGAGVAGLAAIAKN